MAEVVIHGVHTWGKALRLFRQGAARSQLTLAREAEISIGRLWKAEAGFLMLNREELLRIAKVLGQPRLLELAEEFTQNGSGPSAA